MSSSPGDEIDSPPPAMEVSSRSRTPTPSNDRFSKVVSPIEDESLAEESEFQDLALDDDSRFSTVPLSAVSLTTPDAQSTLVGSPKDTNGHATASKGENDNVHSPTGNVPFLLSKLDREKERSERDPRARQSAEGTQLLQQEFDKVHRGENGKPAETQIDWDFWGAVMADYQTFVRNNSEKLAGAIEAGIPNSLRGMMWQLMCASKDVELERLYAKFLKETSPHEKAIIRDLGRTFPHHDFFMDGQGIGQETLFNVLKAYSLYDPQVGYCQGLPFVVAVLLLNMPDEEAFCVLVRLMYSYDLRGHFLPEMPALQLRLYQFDRAAEELLPVLHVHFLRQGIKSSMFCSQWFLTLFSYRFPLPVVFRIYDNVLATGIESIFSFSIALLAKSEEQLLKLKFDDILAYLKSRLFDPYMIAVEGADDEEQMTFDVDTFVQDAFHIKITPFMLDAYAHEWEDLLRAREAHATEMDALRNTNRSLAAQVKSLEDSLAALNKEHCEIVKELVMARLANEEMETELVRYKLMYADLMHQNADAMSSNRLSSNSQNSHNSLFSHLSIHR